MAIKFYKPTVEETPAVPAVPAVETKAEEPKKRGRKKKEETELSDNVIPLDISPNVAGIEPEAKPKAKRGRKASESKAVSVDAITRNIFAMHQMLNVIYPGTAIPPEKAELLAESVKTVADEFGFVINPKVAAIIGLVTTAAIVEGPVIMTIRNQLAQQSARQKAAEQAKREAQKVAQSVDSGQPMPTVENPATQVTAQKVGGVEIAEGEPLKFN